MKTFWPPSEFTAYAVRIALKTAFPVFFMTSSTLSARETREQGPHPPAGHRLHPQPERHDMGARWGGSK